MAAATAPSSASLPADLAAVHSSFLRSNREIHSFQLPRLHSCSTAAALADYESEVSASIDGLKRTLLDLELAIDDAETSRERDPLATIVRQLKTELETTRQATRKALIAARRNVENSRTASAREGLKLAADSAKERTGGRGGGSSGEDKLMTTSQDVTDALRRTVTLMSAELEKSALSSSLLEESSQTLTTLSSQYGSLSTLMANSAHIIKTMEREDLIGKGILAASMLFFLGCVAYILYVRLVSRGFGILAFFWRILGLGRLFGGGGGVRSVDDIKEKIDMLETAAATTTASLGKAVKEAVRSMPPSLAATAITSAAMAGATKTAAAPSHEAEAVVEEAVWDGHGRLNDLSANPLVDSVEPAGPFGGEASNPTRQYTRPTERVEL
ncbi:uncharacterized protein PFL1_05182 [Pseudozyma flocculosa PF-1]|uniref:Sec20 C-terminal domain-containing protein n=2 Tax=Pseudozyma flocculosa TaxID=84751 RepID=A0A5C3F8A8_9BASI|nr:uncharacterized protein PFL1_05182 [Pseudozyma flocculosa PF-1]EPQ27259.1 hypothetical protein PFL1_05182 [Pseudozyma flocculosa PF-1]SPO39629.1 uncharacterized protein PSFLO_05110 [Pseudozyma flocculosa]